MSNVLKKDQRPTKDDVYDYWTDCRLCLHDLLIRKFGYKFHLAEKKELKKFGVSKYEDLDDLQKETYDAHMRAIIQFNTWYIDDSRQQIMDAARGVTKYLALADASTGSKRINYFNNALGYCNFIEQELQFIIDTLPVSVDTFMIFGEMLGNQMKLIESSKGYSL